MVLGTGPNGYLVTVVGKKSRVLLIMEVWAPNMRKAIAAVEAITKDEIVTCVKLWV